jgi:flagellar L-ring protein FlgH
MKNNKIYYLKVFKVCREDIFPQIPAGFMIFLALMILTGCAGLQEAREIKEAPMPPKYVEAKPKEYQPAEGSLWRDRATLYEDRKARRVNDVVTVLISETSAATKKATTNASRDSSADYGITNFFGMNPDYGVQGWALLKDFYHSGNVFAPAVSGTGASNFKGTGDTARQGSITASISARVVEVLPNQNLVLESRKEILVNNEKEILVFKGMIRVDDISPTNTVLSRNVANAQIYLVGNGVLDDKQHQGWLVRFFDKVWPF